MQENYPIVEDPWIDPFEEIFLSLWIMNRYLKNPFDILNYMSNPYQSIDWKIARQKIISEKKVIKLLAPPKQESLKFIDSNFDLN
jgi:hypothetical protein